MHDWTLEEARTYLPRLRQLLRVVRAAAELAARAPTNGHGGARHGSNGSHGSHGSHGSPGPLGSEPDGEPDPDPEGALEELEAKGVIVRDLARGLVDFPSLHLGRRVLLCWLADDEQDIDWWHLPDEGFAGRKRLPLPPEF